LEKETPNKKRLEGGKRRKKKTSLGVWIKDAGQGRCSHSIPKRSKTWLGRAISLGSSKDFHLDHPNQGR
jgi:hypothetical protein